MTFWRRENAEIRLLSSDLMVPASASRDLLECAWTDDSAEYNVKRSSDRSGREVAECWLACKEGDVSDIDGLNNPS